MQYSTRYLNMSSVLIGVPTFNRIKTLPRTLNSILEQTYTNYDVLISDNCSTDSTVEYLTKFCGNHSAFNFVIQKSNLGIIGNFRYLVNKSEGYKYFCWLGGDDYWSPRYLERCISALEADHSVGVVQTSVHLVDIEYGSLKRKYHYRLTKYLNYPFLQTPLLFMRGYNIFISGIHRAELVRPMFAHFKEIPSGDRYFLILYLLNGYKIKHVENEIFYNGMHERPSYIRYQNDSFFENLLEARTKLVNFKFVKRFFSIVTAYPGKYHIKCFACVCYFYRNLKNIFKSFVKKLIKW